MFTLSTAHMFEMSLSNGAQRSFFTFRETHQQLSYQRGLFPRLVVLRSWSCCWWLQPLGPSVLGGKALFVRQFLDGWRPLWSQFTFACGHARLSGSCIFQSHATFRIDDNFTEKLKFQSFQKILPVSEQNHPQRIIRRSRKPFNHKNNKIGKLLKSFLFRAYALRDLVGKSSWRRRISFQWKKMAVVGRQNQLEYFLQGSIGKDSVHTLLHRLRGLCDGMSRQVTTFGDHEMVFTLGKCSSLFCLACQEKQRFFLLLKQVVL